MTFLTAAQSAAIRLIGKKPTTFFSSTGQFELEITDLANELCEEVVKYGDWRKLTTLKQMAGDGTTIGFDLPSDYDRMPIDGEVSRANWYTWGYRYAPSLNYWRDLVNGLASPNPGYWIMLDGQIQFQPPVSASTTAEYYYISKNVVLGADAVAKAKFTKDDDTFIIDDRVLTLGLIWKWRAQKRLEYAEDMQNYEIRIAQVSGADKGARVISGGKRSWDADVRSAYPRPLGV